MVDMLSESLQAYNLKPVFEKAANQCFYVQSVGDLRDFRLKTVLCRKKEKFPNLTVLFKF